MIHEKDLEDIICKYPDLIEDGLSFKGRQIILYGRRMDILFEDKFKRKLIIELKVGPIKDAHIGQILSYEGMLLSDDDPSIRVMLVGNRVPPNIQRSLDHHGIAWQEITFSHLKTFLEEKQDSAFLNLMNSDETPILHTNEMEKEIKKPVFRSADDIIEALKMSELYVSFRTILTRKTQNEERARAILIENIGNLSIENLKQIITLMDEPYGYNYRGKVGKNPWFGRLLQANTTNLFTEDIYKVNSWFNTLSNNSIPVDKRLELLQNEPYNIRGLNVGFMTLLLYILNKSEHQIWFQSLHDGLKLIYTDIETYTGKGKQYMVFNETAKKFAIQYSFEHTELDWIFSTGLPFILNVTEDSNFTKKKSSRKSGLRDLQKDYWQKLNDYMETRGSSVKMRIARSKSWSDISLGTSDIYLAVGINSITGLMNIWLVIRGNKAKDYFDRLHKICYEKSLSEISNYIIWDRMEGRQRCAVILQKPADFININEWEPQFTWLKEYIEKYVRFFKPKIKNLLV
jgi:hypothetical protein